MGKIILLLIFLSVNSNFSQVLNQYKYALVPEKFDFLKEKNQYHLNDLTKSAMQKYGFESYFVTEVLPKDITNENKLYVDVLENSSMIYTKLIVVLRDYTNKILFQSAEGKSKEKEFSDAYEECFRQAVKSLDILKHQYSEINVPEIEPKVIVDKTEYEILIPFRANKTSNGFKLFDGNVILKYLLLETSNPNIFIVKIYGKHQDGVLIHKKDEFYSLEYYNDGKLIQESISIVF